MRIPKDLHSRSVLALLLGICLLPARAETKPPPVVTCASCHLEQTSMQPQTQMGRAMQLPGDNPALQARPRLTFRKGAYSYTVETRNGKSQYSVTDGTATISLPIHWTMGAQAQTWLLEKDGKLYESLVSYYPSIDALDLTTGDEAIKPATLEQAMGREQPPDDARACFGCHSTNAVIDHKLNLSTLQPGLTCEHCHVGATAHLAGIVQGDLSSVPPKLARLSSEDMSNFCGQCHRTWETVVRSHWRGETNVRFQPYRLANSKCFDGADPRIACTACHDPHQQVVHDSAYYDAKCAACHAPLLTVATPGPAPAPVQPHARLCPVAKSNCASCHMPSVPLPNGHLRFTDHQIRIVKASAPFPN